MSKTKHDKTNVDFDKAYESNVVGMKGVLYFGIGLFLLIVITFGLMWIFLDVIQENADKDDELNRNPLAFTKEQALPPVPRLQSAPGFGVGTGADRTNLELREPQAEYRVLHKQWEDQLRNGEMVKGDDGRQTVVSLPIEEAKKEILEERAGDTAATKNGEKSLRESRMLVSPSSAGRMSAGKRR